MNRVIVGKGKGVMALQDIKNGGYNVAIVRLTSKGDVDGLETILHFTDRECLVKTINAMKTLVKKR